MPLELSSMISNSSSVKMSLSFAMEELLGTDDSHEQCKCAYDTDEDTLHSRIVGSRLAVHYDLLMIASS